MTLHEINIEREALSRVWERINRPGNLSDEVKQHIKGKFKRLRDEEERLEKIALKGGG